MNHLTTLALLLFLSHTLSSQTEAAKERARALGTEAIELMDNVEFEPSRAKLLEAKALDPSSYVYDYEIGYSYYLQEDYKPAIKALKKTAKRPDAGKEVFQLIGNAYDYLENKKKANKAYQEGIERFPNSAVFHVELGIMEQLAGNWDEAGNYWEAGIRVDPNYPSNYYHLSRLFARTDKHLWTALYGETFMNLERGSARTAEISELLLTVYQTAIELGEDTASVHFIKDHQWSLSAIQESQFPSSLLFGINMTLATVSIKGEKEINVQTFPTLRAAFLEAWDGQELETKPNYLFDWLREIKDAGHFEAYNAWLVSEGDKVGFEFWMSSYPESWTGFVDWFNENQLEIEVGTAPIRVGF